MSDKLFSALKFAAHAHMGQYRKGTSIPYLVHPVSVMQYLIKNNAPADAVIAGVLHDTLEDTATTPAQLRATFGDRVTELVIGASEPDKSLSWHERKAHTLATLSQTSDIAQLMVCCADKLHNVTCTLNDYKQYGDAVWERFNRGYLDQKWYYTSLADIFARHTSASAIFSDYIAVVRELFGTSGTN